MKKINGGAALGLASVLLAGTCLDAEVFAATTKSPLLIPHTLQEALAQAYLTNPQLEAERANLRSVDENVPTALAGWRPTVSVAVSGTDEDLEQKTNAGGVVTTFGPETGANGLTGAGAVGTKTWFNPIGYQATGTITEPLYNGGKTSSSTHEAVNKVYAERANLLATEETVLYNVVQAYIGVIEDKQLLQLQINNEQVLAEQLRATEDRFRVGEITRTDVAQAESALASARAARQSASGTLETANASYVQQVGSEPPVDIVEPQPLATPVKTEQEAMVVAVENNPNVVYQLFNEAQSKDAVDVAWSNLMPKASLEIEYIHEENQSEQGIAFGGLEGLLNLQVPLYQGGAEYAAIRQARQTAQMARRTVDEARRTALQTVISAWESLISSRAAVDSDRAAVRAGFVALDGVERQAIVGTSTTLEVLQQQQTLLNAQTSLVQNLSTLVLASYAVSNALGRLTARDLHLDVPLYDETAYYNAVRDRLWGTNDYATQQPGR